jgi:GT2 family glycosyltransferase
MKMNGMLKKLLSSHMKYSIIIPTYNHCVDLLKPCIDSIKKTTDLSSTEIIVVANGCTDGTKEYMESLGKPFKLLYYEEKLGFTKAINEGIKQSKGEYLIFLNNDTVLNYHPVGWLNILEEPFKKYEKVGMTGPLLCNTNKEGLNDFLMFFCVMTNRKIIDEIGILDEMYSPGGLEDADFCLRLSLAGYKLIEVPEQ